VLTPLQLREGATKTLQQVMVHRFSRNPLVQKPRPVNFEVEPVKIENQEVRLAFEFSKQHLYNSVHRYFNCDIHALMNSGSPLVLLASKFTKFS
jgi:hypothetical protein